MRDQIPLSKRPSPSIPIGPIAMLVVVEGSVLAHLFGFAGQALLVEMVLATLIGLICMPLLVRWPRSLEGRGCGGGCVWIPVGLLLLQLAQWFSILLAAQFGGPELFYTQGLESFSIAERILLVVVVGIFWAGMLCFPTSFAAGIVMAAAERNQAPDAANIRARLTAELAPWCTASVITAVCALIMPSRVGAWMSMIANALCIASVLF